MLRFYILLIGLFVAFGAGAETPNMSQAPTIEVYKTPTCGCCKKWMDHMEEAGFKVKSTDLRDLSPVKRQHKVPLEASACHTAVVDGYVIEGHVPAKDIQRLLAEKPEVRGLVVPGMPLGSPGMEHPMPEAYSVYTLGPEGKLTVFSSYP